MSSTYILMGRQDWLANQLKYVEKQQVLDNPQDWWNHIGTGAIWVFDGFSFPSLSAWLREQGDLTFDFKNEEDGSFFNGKDFLRDEAGDVIEFTSTERGIVAGTNVEGKDGDVLKEENFHGFTGCTLCAPLTDAIETAISRIIDITAKGINAPVYIREGLYIESDDGLDKKIADVKSEIEAKYKGELDAVKEALRKAVYGE